MREPLKRIDRKFIADPKFIRKQGFCQNKAF